RKPLITYTFVLTCCQFVLIASLHLAAAIHGRRFESISEGRALPLATVWALAAVRWLYIVPMGFLIGTVISARKHAADAFFVHLLGGLMITSVILSVFIVLGLSCPLIEIIEPLSSH